MRDLITKIKEKLFIPICILAIIYCLFLNELRNTTYFLIISYILLALGIFLVIISIFESIGGAIKKDKRIKIKYNRPDNFKDFIFVHSVYIINYSFYIYFFVYVVFKLDERSIIFNYLLLIIFGIFLGYRIAAKVFLYFEAKENQ